MGICACVARMAVHTRENFVPPLIIGADNRNADVAVFEVFPV
jgi:hypothetical protein